MCVCGAVQLGHAAPRVCMMGAVSGMSAHVIAPLCASHGVCALAVRTRDVQGACTLIPLTGPIARARRAARATSQGGLAAHVQLQAR